MIILSKNKQDVWCKVDRKLKPILEQYNWKLDAYGYPTAYIENRLIKMSKFIIELENIPVPDGHVISYKNNNRLDNQIKNLQIIRRNVNKKK